MQKQKADESGFRITQTKLARALDQSTSTLVKWQREYNMPPGRKIGRWRYLDLREFLPWYESFTRSKGDGSAGSDDPDVLSYAQAKHRTEIERGRKLEIDNQVRTGELIPMTDLAVVIGAAFGEVAARLDSIKAELRRKAPHLGAGDIDIVMTVVAEARNRVSADNINIDKLFNIQPEAV